MLDRICIPVQAELAQVEDVLAAEISSGMETMDSIARYAIKNGGKRIRPTILLLAARVTGADGGDIPRLAAAVEMFHTASLLHDDVVDDAQVRRGQSSAKAKWGNQVSVLVGDLLFCRASKILVEHGDRRLMQAVNEAVVATTEGELLEIEHQNDITLDADTYMRIIRGKTAALFAVAARAGAIAAGVERSFEDALGMFGLAVGEAFQLADDALDYVADEARFGKAAGTDLKEGKLTYPLIVALAKAGAEERQAIRSALIAGHLTRERFREVASIIERHGGISAALDLARQIAGGAKKHLELFKPSIERDALISIADYAVERDE
ncbi:MAG: polyprenyl synthetase family protein [Pseudomonadota bacterium]